MMAKSALANDFAKVSVCTPKRMVFDLGSTIAIIRSLPTCLRKPSSVVAIAVG